MRLRRCRRAICTARTGTGPRLKTSPSRTGTAPRADTTARRLRIVEVETDPADENRALVTFVQDTYSQGGLFGGGNTWSRRGVVEVVREEGEWKINAQEFFY